MAIWHSNSKPSTNNASIERKQTKQAKSAIRTDEFRTGRGTKRTGNR